MARQPDALPTNKLAVAALIGPAVTEAWPGIMADFYPALSGPASALLAGALASLVIGWFVPDRANV